MRALVPDDHLPAPDFAGTLEAWRVWRVVPGHGGERVLRSVIKSTVWPRRTALCAECLCSRGPLAWIRRKHQHIAPEASCECGIYAADLERLGQYLDECSLQPATGRVLGVVSLWGQVIECQRGFRASHAYPLRIYIPSDGADEGSAAVLAGELAAYGVDVETLDARCRDAPRALADRQRV